MFFISLPVGSDLLAGTKARVNGHDVIIKSECTSHGDYLTYVDATGILNRCFILHTEQVENLPMPDGTKVGGLSFTCASHGQDPNACMLV